MSGLPYETLRSALAAQPLFEAKTWQLSPEAWPLSPEEVAQLEAIGTACLEFHQALETLYLRSAAGKKEPSRTSSVCATPGLISTGSLVGPPYPQWSSENVTWLESR